jgi:hypothetical protein
MSIASLFSNIWTIKVICRFNVQQERVDNAKSGHVWELLDRSGLPDTAVDYKKALEARKLLSVSKLHCDRRHSERTMQITAVDYKKALEARKLLNASDLHCNRCHSERTTQMLTQQCRRQALLAMSA